jgi:small subunit ribosomal protein S20
MPHSKQAKKRNRQSEERRVRNKAARTRMKNAVKRVLAAQDGEQARAALPAAMKVIDKAAKSNAIHANAAARYKSRMARRAAVK